MRTKRLRDFCHARRFFIGAFLLALALGFYVDLKPLFDQFYNLSNQENNLSLQLREKERALEQAGPVSNRLKLLRSGTARKPLLDQLTQAAEINACKINKLQTEFTSGETQSTASQNATLLDKRLIIKMQLYSEYFSFYQFLETLMQQGLPLRLDNFSLIDQGDWLALVLQFSVYPGAFWTAAKLSPYLGLVRQACCARDPFRDASLPLNEFIATKPSFSQNFTLEQIRYVGYLAQAGKTGALILLPDGKIYDIYPGSRLGKAPWQVLKINSQVLILKDERQKKWLHVTRT